MTIQLGIYGFIASLVWAGVAAYAIHRFAALFAARQPAKPESQLAVQIPPDLQAFIAHFASDWAKADAAKSIRERYAVAQDWNVVRRAVGLGVID